jgi:hypothetical protein
LNLRPSGSETRYANLRQRSQPHLFLSSNLISSCPSLLFPVEGLTLSCDAVSPVLRLGASTTLPRRSSEESGRAGVENAKAYQAQRGRVGSPSHQLHCIRCRAARIRRSGHAERKKVLSRPISPARPHPPRDAGAIRAAHGRGRPATSPHTARPNAQRWIRSGRRARRASAVAHGRATRGAVLGKNMWPCDASLRLKANTVARSNSS